MKKTLLGLFLGLAILCSGLSLCAFAEEKTQLAAPTDFIFDTNTGEYSFTANDANAGYYFIRVYPVIDGAEGTQYVASSKRINGGKASELKGQMDVSGIGWGAYHVKLITFTASGTNYTAPSAVIINAFYGVGGTLERPEMMALADGNQVEFIIDWVTLSDYYCYQYLPNVKITIYADADCTTEVAGQTVSLSALQAIVDAHPAGGYMWGFTTTSDHYYILGNEANYGFIHNNYAFTLDAGTYYATVQAISDDEAKIASSKVSDVIEFTLTADGPSGEFKAIQTSLWKDPEVLGIPIGRPGSDETRVDLGANQATTSYAE